MCPRPGQRPDGGALTCDVHSVPRLDLVHEVIVSKEDYRVRRLPRGHVFRRLLELDLEG